MKLDIKCECRISDQITAVISRSVEDNMELVLQRVDLLVAEKANNIFTVNTFVIVNNGGSDL